MDSITWTVPLREELRLAYRSAVAENKPVFKFVGRDFATEYAKYLLEYLDDQLGERDGAQRTE